MKYLFIVNKNFANFKNTKDRISHQLYLWVSGWFDIFDGLIAVFSLGFIHSEFSYRFIFWYTERKDKKYDSKNLNRKITKV